MPRLHFLSGSIALIALSGVKAGPCRPSSSVVTTTTGVETTVTMSTDIGDTITTSLTSLAATESTGTLSVTLSASVTSNTETAAATTTALVESDTTTAMVTGTATTTADTTTTTLATTTSAAPIEACTELASTYTAPGGTKFDIECGVRPMQFQLMDDGQDLPNFKTCVNACDENQECVAVMWSEGYKECYLLASLDYIGSSDGTDIARVRSRNSQSP